MLVFGHSLLGSICNVQRESYKKIESFREQLRYDVLTIKGKRLCLHFDDKLVKQLEEDLSVTYYLENCCQCDISR
jgi:hypothetical protein